VLKSEKARGKLSFLAPANKILVSETLRQKAKKFGIRIDQIANVGNHIHLKIKISNRENFQKFLNATTTLIARKITGACRGKPFGKFWQGLA
jgi:REP element-mobilizing transposase RayT